MDLATVTVAQFQAQFFRGFPYLDSIIYDPAVLYNTDDEVYFPATRLFYTAQYDGIQGVAPNAAPAPNPPAWAKAVDNTDNYIQDQDITNAFAEATALLNPDLFPDDATTLLGYLYLTAHFLCNDIKAALAGVSASAQFLLSSRTVGSVSESYQIPEAYLKNPNYAFYTTSSYGMKYLQMILPSLVGNMAGVYGGTNP